MSTNLPSQQADVIARLRARLRTAPTFAPAWRPQPGDELVGAVVAIGHVTNATFPTQEPYPVLTIADENGEQWAFHGFHAVARDQIERACPRVGDLIGIAYAGKVEPVGGGNEYHSYRVEVERAGEQ